MDLDACNDDRFLSLAQFLVRLRESLPSKHVRRQSSRAADNHAPLEAQRAPCRAGSRCRRTLKRNAASSTRSISANAVTGFDQLRRSDTDLLENLQLSPKLTHFVMQKRVIDAFVQPRARR